MHQRSLSDVVVPMLVLVIIFLGSARAVHYFATGTSNAELVSRIFYPCKEMQIVQSARMAIIRIDDVQAYSLEDVSMRMMDDAKERSIPLVLGVIPMGMNDATPIRAHLKANLCWIEIAQHGWDHNGSLPDVPEFNDPHAENPAEDIARGKALLEELSGEKVTTFIPPLNTVSEKARRAIAALGMRVISGEGANEFDYGATTFNFLTDSLNTPDVVLRDCENRVERTSLCVVMVHPQDYVTNGIFDPDKYQTYLNTLDALKGAGYSFVRFNDLVGSQK